MSMDEDDKHYEGALLEEVNAKIDRLAEALADVPARLRQVSEDVGQLKDDMTVVKAAVTDQSKQLQNHEQRIGDLEQAAA